MEEIAKEIPDAIGKCLAKAMEETPLTRLIRRVQNEGITRHTFLQYVSHRWDKIKEGEI